MNKPVKLLDTVKIELHDENAGIYTGKVIKFKDKPNEDVFFIVNDEDEDEYTIEIDPKIDKYEIIKEAPESNKNFFDKLIYTIVDASYNNEMIAGVRKIIPNQNKIWTKGKEYFEEAKEKNKKMYCFLADSNEIINLRCFGEIEDIKIVGKSTECTLKNIYSLDDLEIPFTEILLRNNEYLGADYIRSYIIGLIYNFIDTINEVTKNEKKEIKIKEDEKGNVNPEKRIITTQEYQRNPKVREMAIERASGHCDLCHKGAPFKDKNGNPYLEGHHLIPLSDGGPDIIENMAALCPNCHKLMHLASDEIIEEKKKYLLSRSKVTKKFE